MTIKKTLTFLFLYGLVWGQFKADVSQLNTPATMHEQLSKSALSLLDPSRFNIQHGFSVSMTNLGGQMISVGSYSNRMTFILRENLRLRTNFTLMQSPATAGNSQILGNGDNLFYGASLEYQPTENSALVFSIDNYPLYQRRINSPFQLGVR